MAAGHPRAWKRFATIKALPVQHSQHAPRCGDTAAQPEAAIPCAFRRWYDPSAYICVGGAAGANVRGRPPSTPQVAEQRVSRGWLSRYRLDATVSGKTDQNRIIFSSPSRKYSSLRKEEFITNWYAHWYSFYQTRSKRENKWRKQHQVWYTLSVIKPKNQLMKKIPPE